MNIKSFASVLGAALGSGKDACEEMGESFVSCNSQETDTKINNLCAKCGEIVSDIKDQLRDDTSCSELYNEFGSDGKKCLGDSACLVDCSAGDCGNKFFDYAMCVAGEVKEECADATLCVDGDAEGADVLADVGGNDCDDKAEKYATCEEGVIASNVQCQKCGDVVAEARGKPCDVFDEEYGPGGTMCSDVQFCLGQCLKEDCGSELLDYTLCVGQEVVGDCPGSKLCEGGAVFDSVLAGKLVHPEELPNGCPHDCSGHGTCAGGLCDCDIGYYGPDCSSRVLAVN